MHSAPDPVRLEAAQARFVAFFNELSRTFIERDDVLTQIALALLCREHVLLTGPPGTAKSLLAAAVFGRLIDEETGSASLYARQFTESTVQTDLIGPINFKTLTESGRTEHFTDEGMLGAVHAFLDEVFDGRDMLLRSALNVLHEREIRQGTRITRGKFECAFMASNRYLVEVLESSRETLLAFVDRIAFVGFVPRGFADPQNLGAVIRGQISGASRMRLEAPLTIQDIDALQMAVDAVYVSDAMCDGLAALLDLLDAELCAAVRADPTFVPTRYLSTRTAVRSGKILRAICVHDKLFHRPGRPLEVLPEDLAALRLHLLLSGPSPEATLKLLERETEPRERRQLGIIRTERELFDRCVAKLPPIHVTPRPAPEPRRAPSGSTGEAVRESALAAGTAGTLAGKDAPAAPVKTELESRAEDALKSGNVEALIDAVRALIPVSLGGGASAEQAATLIKECVTGLQARSMREGLALGGDARPIQKDAVKELASLAETLDGAPPEVRPLGRWLRGRALMLIGDAAAYGLGVSAQSLAAAMTDDGGFAPALRAEERLAEVEALGALRQKLLAKGVDALSREGSEAAWTRGIARAEEEIALLCDAALEDAAKLRLWRMSDGELASVLSELAPELERIGALSSRLAALHTSPASGGGSSAGGSDLRARVLGPRIGLLIEAAFARQGAIDRSALSGEIEAMLDVLSRAGLLGVVAPRAWVGWTASALVRSEASESRASDVHSADARGHGSGEVLSYEGYRLLREAAPRATNGFVLAEVALRVAPGLASSGADPAEGLAAIAGVLAEIPPLVRAEVVQLDMVRIERAVGYLERWWQSLAGPASPPEGAPGQAADDDRRLRDIVVSRFFTVLLEEAALARFVLESRLIADLFPDRAAHAETIRGRIDDLEARARQRVFELFKRRSDEAWMATLRAKDTGSAAGPAGGTAGSDDGPRRAP